MKNLKNPVSVSLVQHAESLLVDEMIKQEHLECFQELRNNLKENFTSLQYNKRRSYVSETTQRTSFTGTEFISDSTVRRMKLRVEDEMPRYTVRRTRFGNVAIYAK